MPRARLGAHAPGPLGGVLRGARKVAEALVTPLVPEDYLDLVRPAAGRCRPARPHRRGAPRDRRRRDRRHPARSRLARPRARAVHPHRHRHRRRAPLARLQPHPPRRRLARGRHPRRAASPSRPRRSPTARSATTWCAPRAPGTLVMLDQATGDFTLPSPAPAKVLFLTAGSGITPVMGMLRNHLAELSDVAHVHCAPTASDVIFASELRGVCRRRAPRAHASTSTTSTASSTSTASTPSCPTGASARRGSAAPPACSTPPRPTGRGRRRRPPAHRALPPHRRRARRGWRRSPSSRSDVTVDADGSTPDPRRGRGGRHPHAERLPDGHLLRLRRDDAQRRHPRPAHRRHHRRRGRRDPARPDLRQRRRRLPARSSSDPHRPHHRRTSPTDPHHRPPARARTTEGPPHDPRPRAHSPPPPTARPSRHGINPRLRVEPTPRARSAPPTRSRAGPTPPRT